MQFRIDHLINPETGQEMPLHYRVNDFPVDIIHFTVPEAYFYLILERVNYRRQPGRVEGFFLRFEVPGSTGKGVTFGSAAGNDIVLEGLSSKHFTVEYVEGIFVV